MISQVIYNGKKQAYLEIDSNSRGNTCSICLLSVVILGYYMYWYVSGRVIFSCNFTDSYNQQFRADVFTEWSPVKCTVQCVHGGSW